MNAGFERLGADDAPVGGWHRTADDVVGEDGDGAGGQRATPVGSVELSEGARELVEAAEDDLDVVGAREVAGECGGWRKLLEVLGEDLATAATSLAVLHGYGVSRRLAARQAL